MCNQRAVEGLITGGTASLSLQAGVGVKGGWGLPAYLQSSITQADAGWPVCAFIFTSLPEQRESQTSSGRLRLRSLLVRLSDIPADQLSAPQT